MDCTIYVAKTRALFSFAVTAKLICVFVFAYAKSRFSHDAAHIRWTMDRCILEFSWESLHLPRAVTQLYVFSATGSPPALLISTAGQ